MVNKKATGLSKSMTKGFAIGAAWALLLTVSGSALLSVLILEGAIEWNIVGYGAMTIVILSSFVSAFTAAKAVKRRKVLVCASSGIIYLVLLTIGAAILSGGEITSVWINTVLIAIGDLLALIFCMDRSTKRRRARTIQL